MSKFIKMGIMRTAVGLLWLLSAACSLFDGLVFNFIEVGTAVLICSLALVTLTGINKNGRIKEYDVMKIFSGAFNMMNIFVLVVLVVICGASVVLNTKMIKVDLHTVVLILIGVMDILTGVEFFKMERKLKFDSDDRISNYEAIVRMNIDELECCLDDIYVAGLNEGMYAAKQDEETMMEIIGDFPFDKNWLEEKAESSVFHKFESTEDELKTIEED